MPSSILNSDDGVISGTSGLKSSGGDDGVLVFQSKGTETARINTDKQIVAAAGTVSLPSITTTGDVNTGIFFSAADTLVVTTGGTAAVTVDSGQRTKFPTTIGVGDATPSASGSGITFPATQSASTNANTLDDYEEGTWTPSLGGDATYSNQVGRYIKIGNQVFAHFALAITTQGTGSTISAISGLPFASGIASQNCSNLTWSGLGVAMTYGVYYVGASGTTLNLAFTTTAATTVSFNPNSLVNGASINGSIVYTV
jgi:hypothetical protein